MNRPAQNPTSHRANLARQTVGGWLFIGLVLVLIVASIAVPHFHQKWRQTQLAAVPNPSAPPSPPRPAETLQAAPTLPTFAEIQPAFTQDVVATRPATPSTPPVNFRPQLDGRRALRQESPLIASLPTPAIKQPLRNVVDDMRRWPDAAQLRNQIVEAASQVSTPAVGDWAERTLILLNELTAIQPMTAEMTDYLLQELAAEAENANRLAEYESVENRQLLRRAGYAIVRRADVWQAAAAVLRQDTRVASQSDPAVLAAAEGLKQFFGQQTHGDSWLALLKVNDLADVIEFNRRADHVRAVYAAITTPQVAKEHRQVLALPAVEEYLVAIGGWAEVRRDLPQWLQQLEAAETDPSQEAIDSLSKTALFWPASPLTEVRSLSLAWQRHYRNANVRVAISEDFLNRMMPKPSVTSEPIVDQILGARVLGSSHTSSEVKVKLVPDADRWNLQLQASGVITSDTQSTKGPVTFVSDGVSTYHAQKQISFDGETIQTSAAGATAGSSTQLRSLSTDYDDIPIIGGIVRRIAINEHDETVPQANSIVRGRVASQAQQRMDSEIHERVTAAEGQINARLLEPLESMHLAATAVELETTSQRCVARYRIAGPRLWGGHTPRPEALASSWLSMQLHETLINNALTGLDLAGQEVTLAELYRKVQKRLGANADSMAVPEDFPEDVTIRFAKESPARVRFDDGRIEVELKLAELRARDRQWNDFSVKVHYTPQGEGLQTEFSRDGIVYLSANEGKIRFGDRIVLSGIFSKVFGQSRPMPIIPPSLRDDPRLAGLTLAPTTVDAGWIGVALIPTPQFAQQNSAGERSAQQNDCCQPMR